MVAASSGLILLNGVGAILGPISVSALMSAFGPSAFFPFIAAACCCIVLFGLYRMSMRPSVPIDDQVDFVAMPVRSGLVAVNMNPESEEWDEEETGESLAASKLSKAAMEIMADSDDDDDDEEEDPMDDGPTLWNRNG